mmetsp:Transcript_22192/g.33097  ORF Transcript_22192/g.33097 Transcript_22192/m.33097 type:complete len:670 (+) Transcript_22192:114-2123(+)
MEIFHLNCGLLHCKEQHIYLLMLYTALSQCEVLHPLLHRGEQQQRQQHLKKKRGGNDKIGDKHDNIVWSQTVQKTLATQSERIEAFESRIYNISRLFLSLLRVEGCDDDDVSYNLLSSAIPVKDILDVAETMLSFPTASEARYNSTRPRLRDTVVEDGLLSPRSAVHVANFIKSTGHELFDCLLSCIRHGGALEYGRRISRIALSGLQSGCSRALRRAVDDPSIAVSSSSSNNKMRRRWLHGSVVLRTRAVRSVRAAILTLKSNSVVIPSDVVSGVDGSSSSSSSMGKAIVLVCGCLLEQISFNEEDLDAGGVVDNWGTVGERVGLIDACAEALSSCIATCGGYIPSSIRSTIDSVMFTCLSTLDHGIGGTPPPLRVLHASTKVSLLRLGIDCVCAPWSDGGTSGLVGIVRKAAAVLKSDRDNAVSSAAHSALCVIDALATPRAPPLTFVSRNSYGMPVTMERGLSSSAILQGIQAARNEEAVEREKKRKESELRSAKEKTIENDKKRAREESKRNNGNVAASLKESSLSPINKSANSKIILEKDAVPNEKKAVVDNTSNSSTTIQTEKMEETSETDMDMADPKDDTESAKTEAENQNSTIPTVTKNSTEDNQSTEKPTNGFIPKMDTDVSMDEKLDVKDEGLAGEDDNTDDDEAFPDIIDCDPDEDDL